MTPRTSRWLLAAAVAGTAGILTVAGLQDTLTYYRTPSEVLRQPTEARVRLGGEVVPGSLHRSGEHTRFRIGDGAAEVAVDQAADLPGLVREGQQVVVEGILGPDRVFRSDTVMAKHGNEYRAATAAAEVRR
ncbi:cytochrome c maturation protein CcmE [Dactylosporangium aurantiacum]|uniref:Cytochrome c maturation protein CcmE n=1 Tax=Dactylosporangium aurantiacum TaxID=35754 RepID=A0A9Q9MRM2_9ACTN|nr:cytochrome c maturation protein CcmE [Dactylosporangium aurantiacum]MDG6110497.1 cytochrome c maturation protein CcmE [Dactylosporangium aurantiacum]UWZ58647.1 cytochrome c maturation protein CcmE [Dactylosporangium aurantiacum]